MDFYNLLLNMKPSNMNYLGIGSCYHIPLDQMNDNCDQIYPHFMRKFLHDGKTVRCILIDPLFTQEKIQSYIDSNKLGLMYIGLNENIYCWKSEYLEILMIQSNFNHNNLYFLQQFCELHYLKKSYLFVQDYSGNELVPLYKAIYIDSVHRILFQKYILFDISFGEQRSCYINLLNYDIHWFPNGDLFNIYIYEYEDIPDIIYENSNLRTILINYYKRLYLNTVDKIHPDYRRRVLGYCILSTDSLIYNDVTEPDIIMSVLHTRLLYYANIFLKSKEWNTNQFNLFESLFDRYTEIDMYAWNHQIKSLIKWP